MTVQLVLLILQLLLVLLFAIYFLRIMRAQHQSRGVLFRDSHRELERLRELRSVRLNKPLVEQTRPRRMDELIGQEDGVRALRAALCGANPQHVLIYGPPGVGKTAAARLVLEEARNSSNSPFRTDAPYVEVDATIVRYDERGIADPLLGSVHDPIYQGAGALGVAGIPQPKPGAVSRAHGGILFLDEIGELHPHQLNKLLKVLEDGKVMLESAYYSADGRHIPPHIHDLFEKGIPADFRLIGATTRPPEHIPSALRSRCVEIFFKPLQESQIAEIADHALRKLEVAEWERNDSQLSETAQTVARYAQNGRDANHLVQLAASMARLEQAPHVTPAIVEWVAMMGRMVPRERKQVTELEQVGRAYGMAVGGYHQGMLIELEVVATSAAAAGSGLTAGAVVGVTQGTLRMTGIIEEERFADRQRTVSRRSMVRGSLENVLTVMRSMGFRVDDYDLHINVLGSVAVDGPSAGCALIAAIASALSALPISQQVALTGEISLSGAVLPVGGIVEKVEAAKQAGIRRVYIPKANEHQLLQHMATATHTTNEALRAETLEVVAIESVAQLFSHLWGVQTVPFKQIS